MLQPQIALDQHMLLDMSGYRSLLQSVDLQGRLVIELGVGTGQLTRAILGQFPSEVIGYEIDPTLIPLDLVEHPLLDLRIMDFTVEDFGFLRGRNYAFVSNPPYSQLAFVIDLITRFPPEVTVMMVSQKKKETHFPDDEVGLRLGPTDFSTPTSGGHAVIVRRRH